VDATTIRLADRVGTVSWIGNRPDDDSSPSPAGGAGDETDKDKAKRVARHLLGISMEGAAAESSQSMQEVAALTEKPGVKTGSRKEGASGENGTMEMERNGLMVEENGGTADANRSEKGKCTESSFEVAGEA
jgi:hypothetical protein